MSPSARIILINAYAGIQIKDAEAIVQPIPCAQRGYSYLPLWYVGCS